MRTLLWLDDIRNPFKSPWKEWIEERVGVNGYDVQVEWVDCYEHFIDHLYHNGIPDIVCFDHDLGDVDNLHPEDEKTGYHAALFLTDMCDELLVDIPEYYIQSSNPVGREKIDSIMQSYHKIFNH